MKKYYIDNLGCFHIKYLKIEDDSNDEYYHTLTFLIKSILSKEADPFFRKGEFMSMVVPKKRNYIFEFEKNSEALLLYEVMKNE